MMLESLSCQTGAVLAQYAYTTVLLEGRLSR